MPSHSSNDAPPRLVPQLQPTLNDMSILVGDLKRIGRSLNALASLTTSGNPSQTDLGSLNSEDFGALLESLGDLATYQTARLERLVNRAIEASKHC